MSVPTISISKETLVKLGLKHSESIHYQSTPEELVQDTLRMGEGVLTDSGALAINTGEFTGRSPNDKFTVKKLHPSNLLKNSYSTSSPLSTTSSDRSMPKYRNLGPANS